MIADINLAFAVSFSYLCHIVDTVCQSFYCSCKTCGQRSTNCTGHCGHIDLISPVYNPLLFNFLHKLLQRTCFFCFHFRADSNQVYLCHSVNVDALINCMVLIPNASSCFFFFFPLV